MFAKILGIGLALISCTILFLSHSNQNLIPTALSNIYLIWSWMGFGLSLVLLCYALPTLVAVFVWIAIATLVWSFSPFVALLKRSPSDESV